MRWTECEEKIVGISAVQLMVVMVVVEEEEEDDPEDINSKVCKHY